MIELWTFARFAGHCSPRSVTNPGTIIDKGLLFSSCLERRCRYGGQKWGTESAYALGDRDWSGEQVGREDAGLVPGAAKAKRDCGVIDSCKAVYISCNVKTSE